MTIKTGADEVCDILFNDEAARGVVCALHSPKPKHTVYNIATGTGFTMRQFADAVKRAYPNADISIGNTQSQGVNFVLDVSRARDGLDFTAESDVDLMVREYVATMNLLGLAPDGG